MLSRLPRYQPVLRTIQCLGDRFLPLDVLGWMPRALSTKREPVKSKIEARNTTMRWSLKDDKLLQQAVSKHGERWSVIWKTYFPHRSWRQVRGRWQLSLNPSVKSGPWSDKEDAELLRLVDKLGRKWTEIGQLMKGRTGQCCLARYSTALNPALNKRSWTKEDDDTLLKEFAVHGRNWKAIAQALPGRSTTSLLRRYHRLLALRTDWTNEQDERLLAAVTEHGKKTWSKVALVVGQSAAACRDRHGRIEIRRTAEAQVWTPQEDELLIAAAKEHGTNGDWAAIANTIPGKTGADCKSRLVVLLDSDTSWSEEDRKLFADLCYHDSTVRKRRDPEEWIDADIRDLWKAVRRYKGKKGIVWKIVARSVKYKSPEQCKEFYRKELLGLESKNREK